MVDDGALAVSFSPVHEKNVQQLRVLNGAVLPVRYQDKFYREVVTSGKYTQLAYLSDVLVGAVCGRLEPLEVRCRRRPGDGTRGGSGGAAAG